MKTIRRILLFLTFIICISNMISGQDDKASKADISEQKLYEKQLRKEQRQQQIEKMAEITKIMVAQQRFVLEADYISNRYGARISVNPTINFIMVDSLNATVQFGSAYSAGYNGVGGQTLDGRITKYTFDMFGRKKNAYSIRMVFMSYVGVYDITLFVNPEGYADATVRGNWSNQLNYHGKLVPVGISKVYKGQPRY